MSELIAQLLCQNLSEKLSRGRISPGPYTCEWVIVGDVMVVTGKQHWRHFDVPFQWQFDLDADEDSGFDFIEEQWFVYADCLKSALDQLTSHRSGWGGLPAVSRSLSCSGDALPMMLIKMQSERLERAIALS